MFKFTFWRITWNDVHEISWKAEDDDDDDEDDEEGAEEEEEEAREEELRYQF